MVVSCDPLLASITMKTDKAFIPRDQASMRCSFVRSRSIVCFAQSQAQSISFFNVHLFDRPFSPLRF